MVCVDGNCSLGSEQDEHVGSHAADKEDFQGEILHAFFREFGLFVPTTFEIRAFGESAVGCATYDAREHHPHCEGPSTSKHVSYHKGRTH